jgi:hypothetical protein
MAHTLFLSSSQVCAEHTIMQIGEPLLAKMLLPQGQDPIDYQVILGTMKQKIKDFPQARVIECLKQFLLMEHKGKRNNCDERMN